MGVIWDSVTGGFVALDSLLRFSLNEPTNYDERRDWWHELLPIYHAGHAQVYCTPRILVSTYVDWECELLPVTPAPLTVEADGDGCLEIAAFDFAWLYVYAVDQLEFNGRDNHDFQLDDFEMFWLHRLPTVHAVAAQCEVTL